MLTNGWRATPPFTGSFHAPNKLFLLLTDNLNSEKSKLCFRKVKNCGTFCNLSCRAVSICDTLIEHLFWARLYARQMEGLIAFLQGNLNPVGEGRQMNRTITAQRGFLASGVGRCNAEEGWLTLLTTWRKRIVDGTGKAIQFAKLLSCEWHLASGTPAKFHCMRVGL